MARTVSEIQTQIQTELVAAFAAIGITIDTSLWSKRNIMRLFCFVFAACTAYIEQLMDALKTSVESTVAQASAASQQWIQNQMLLFQYSETDPQILMIIDGILQYPTIDATLRIITACAVPESSINNEVSIKVAKTEYGSLTALSSLQLAAAQGYVTQKFTVGINYTVVSLNPDKIYIGANIYYNGQYASTIVSNVKYAITDFLTKLYATNFNGAIKMSELEASIKSVMGVNDVYLTNVRCRADSVTFDSGIQLVLDTRVINRLWNPIAGYAIPETTSGHTLDDSLNFISE